MFYEICAGIAVFMLVLLTVFTLRTLRSLEKTLEQINRLSESVEQKIEQTSSTFQSLSNIGDICQKKSFELRQSMLYSQEREPVQANLPEDLAAWLILSLKLGSKFLKGK